MNCKRHELIRGFVFGMAVVAILAWMVPGALAQLNPTKIPQFVDPLPMLDVVSGGTMQTFVAPGGGNGPDTVTIRMCEFDAKVLPTGTFAAGIAPTTTVWGYVADQACPAAGTSRDTYIGPVIVAQRSEFPYGGPAVDNSLQVTWMNELGTTGGSLLNFWKTSLDQTLHWADPNNLDCAMIGGVPVGMCGANYSGPIPAVPHLHGGEVPPVIDGGPDAWFLSQAAGGYKHHGHAFYSSDDRDNLGDANQAIYSYPNTQEAANLWFHDHVLGATRLNVYAGLAGAYILTDPLHQPPSDLKDPTKIIPLVIQDRSFDTAGQLLMPNVGINPEHPYWVPEFVGNVIAVNGKVWPFLEIGPNRYRFLVLNGSNARAYALDFKVQGKGKSPQFWVIGTDGGYLDNPKAVAQLVVMPGERYDVVVDFAGFKPGTNLLLQNSARTPFPDGAPVQGTTTGRIMEFRVVAAATAGLPVAPTLNFTPTATVNLRPSNALVRLVDTATGSGLVTPQVTRQLTLNEVMGAGGPLEVLVNNTKWSGKFGNTTRDDFSAVTVGGVTEYYSELPQEGQTELWEIVNLTADAHPIHLHLVQFQLMNRQAFNAKNYVPIYDAAFPGGIYIPAYGPPRDYKSGNPNALGGNPDVFPYLVGPVQPPLPAEQGWKDTVIMYPGEVTRIMVRWAPTDLPTTTAATDAFFPFDPNARNHGYVWHCHIIDHEDNEMMRPTQVQPNTSAALKRTYTMPGNY